jgi:N-acetylmuramoyl-L-alanine amidase
MRHFRRQTTILFIIIFIITISCSFAAPPGGRFFFKRKPPAKKSEPTPTPTIVPSPSPTVEMEKFLDENPVEFQFEPSKLKKFTIYSCGYRNHFNGYEEKTGEILIPLSDRVTDMMLDRFETKVKYDNETQEIVFSRKDNKTLRMKVDYPVADFNGEKREIPVPPRLIYGMIHISPNSFARFLWTCFLYDEKNDYFYLDPFLLDVGIETDRGLSKVVAKGTGPFRNRILKLRNPNRFVIDVMNSVLDGKARSITHPVLGEIRFSQHTLMGDEGNIVRIVIPESENFEVALAQSRAPNFVEAELRERRSIAPVQNLAIQKIQNIRIQEETDRVTITLEATGPVQVEGSRLLSPDDRIFIDIPGTVYPDMKNEFNLNSDFLPSLRVAQFQPMPDPRVRIVLPLEGPRKVVLDTEKNDPKKVKIVVTRDMVNPALDRNLFLVSYYPTTGIVICIDPGHGGSDPGAVNRSMGLLEKTLTLDISNRLKDLLTKEGWTVAMTRNTDRDVSWAGSPNFEELGARTSVANGVRADIFVSIHINAAVNTGAKGFSTYWFKSQDQELAKHVQRAMMTQLTCRKDLGIRNDRFFVLAHSRMPAVLVEAGFISNTEDAKMLSDPAFRQKIAESIMEGLRSYARMNNLGSKRR